VLTPNIPEAEALTGQTIQTVAEMERAGHTLLAMGPRAVLIKGGHLPGDQLTDLLLTAQGERVILTSNRQPTRHTHGTGCTYASAIACGLAQGLPLEAAMRHAHRFVAAAIASAPGLGAGHGPLNHNVRLTS